MRTKTLLIASAVALAAAVTSTQAQSTVYSANIVGYVNLAISAGQYTLYTPALDLDGTGTNGTITSVVGTNVDKSAQVLVWNGTAYNTLEYESTSGGGSARGWVLLGTPNVYSPNYPLNVGQGFFLLDSGVSFTNITVTGNVLQGVLTNGNVQGAGVYSLLGSQVPVAGDLTTNLNYLPVKKDQVLVWNGNGYNTYAYQSTSGGGSALGWVLLGTPNVVEDPVLSVGQGFFLLPGAANTSPTWVETYTNGVYVP